MTHISLEEGVRILNNFRSKRAYEAGYTARLEGKPQDAVPRDMHIFSGKWVEGWWAADTDLLPMPDTLSPGTARRLKDIQSLPALGSGPAVEEMLA